MGMKWRMGGGIAAEEERRADAVIARERQRAWRSPTRLARILLRGARNDKSWRGRNKMIDRCSARLRQSLRSGWQKRGDCFVELTIKASMRRNDGRVGWMSSGRRTITDLPTRNDGEIVAVCQNSSMHILWLNAVSLLFDMKAFLFFQLKKSLYS